MTNGGEGTIPPTVKTVGFLVPILMNILFMSNSMSEEKGIQRRYGYSVVATKVANYLQSIGHQVLFAGMQSIGTPYKDSKGILQLGTRYDPFMGDICEDWLRVYKADCFLSMLDLWLPQTDYMPGMCQKLKIPWISHITLNSEPLSPYFQNKINASTYVVAPSKYNHRILCEGGAGGKSVYIPHGCDTKIFKPMPEVKDEIKKRLHIENKSFIAVVVNRNKGLQKRLQDAMRAWAMICNQDPKFKEEAVLLMLHDPLEPDGFRTDIYRDRLGMNNNIKFIWHKPSESWNDTVATFEGDPEGLRHNANIALPPEEVSRIINCCDLSIVPSQSESFCLPALESMACGVPVVMGNHSVGPEHVGANKAGLLVNIAYGEITPLLSEVMNMNLGDFASAIYTMYKDSGFRKECGRNGLAYAKTMDWDNVLPLWKQLFERVEEQRMGCNYQHGRMGL